MISLDEDRLMSVCGGDSDAALALLQLAADSVRDLIERMRYALDQGDINELGIIAHELRGSCSSVGATEIASLASALEDELEIQNATTLAAARIQEFNEALDRLESAARGLRPATVP
ncbi:MAG TPA: Hpt domain-containing protein [Candidatus Baltobacteraceae bacterium]|jgi:HPt (histidine-containing phosphotransfer) domain-containing protein